MRRINHLIDEIIADDNIEESFKYVLRGTDRKNSRSGKKLILNKEELFETIKYEISNGIIHLDKWKEFEVKERDKVRKIQCVPLKERVVLNAIMKIVEKKIHNRYIVDTAASIKDRGGLFLRKRVQKFINEHPDYVKIYKCDIKKYYENIDQDSMMKVLRKTFKDKTLLKLLEPCVRMMPKGLSIGLRSSQAFANLYLSHYLDHIMKDKEGFKGYFRYWDDIVVICKNNYELTRAIKVLKECISNAKLTIKPNEQCWDFRNRCLDFLGYKMYYSGQIKVRTHIKKRFARKWKRIHSKKRRRELLGSFYGITKHAHCKRLFRTITRMNVTKFSDLNLSYVANNGQKSYDCKRVSLGDLTNLSIIILDFEKNVKTKLGEDRYLVHFQYTTGDKEKAKFFTNSEEIKQYLDAMEERKVLPVEVTIKRVTFDGNKVRYSFM